MIITTCWIFWLASIGVASGGAAFADAAGMNTAEHAAASRQAALRSATPSTRSIRDRAPHRGPRAGCGIEANHTDGRATGHSTFRRRSGGVCEGRWGLLLIRAPWGVPSLFGCGGAALPARTR